MIHEKVLHAQIMKEKTGRWSILRSQTLEPNSSLHFGQNQIDR